MSTFLNAVSSAVLWSAIALFFSLPTFFILRRWMNAFNAWVFARFTGPYVLAWICLAPSVVYGSAAFTKIEIAIAYLIMAMAALIVGRFPAQLARAGNDDAQRTRAGNDDAQRTRAGNDDARRTRAESDAGKRIRHFEGFFFAVLMFLSFAGSFMASVTYSEEMRDSAIWTLIWSKQSYPIGDPWFSGFPFPYYYFGYYPSAAIGFFSGLLPLPAYTTALSFVYASYVATLYWLLTTIRLKRPLAIGAAIVIAFGNDFWSFVQFAHRLQTGIPDRLRALTANLYYTPPWIFFLDSCLHPNLMAFFLLPLFLGLWWLCFKRNSAHHVFLFAVAGVMTGWIFGGHKWEFPIYGGISVLALCLRWYQTRKLPAAEAIAFVLSTVIFLLPFRIVPQSVPLAAKFVDRNSTLWDVTGAWLLFVAPLLVLVLQNHTKKLIAAIALFLFIVAVSTNLGAFLILSVGVLFIAQSRQRKIFLPASVALGIILCCELYYPSVDQGRFNLVIKFYVVAWTMLGLAAAFSLKFLRVSLPRWAFAAITIAISSSMLQYAARDVRTKLGNLRGIENWDGLERLARRAPDDAALIRWLSANAEGRKIKAGTILEATGEAYSDFYSRFSSLAGFQDFIGWTQHGNTLQLHNALSEFSRRNRVLDQVYLGALDCAEIRAILKKENIDYVAIGTFEREQFPNAGLQALQNCLSTVTQTGKTALLALD